MYKDPPKAADLFESADDLGRRDGTIVGGQGETMGRWASFGGGRMAANLSIRWRAVAEHMAAVLAFVVITIVCFKLNLSFPTPTFLFLIVIVLLSLRGSFVSSAVASVMAVAILAYFFVPPIYSFAMSDSTDVVAMIGFLTTAAVITRLVSRVRHLMEEKLRQSEAYLNEGQRLSHTGSFGWRVSSGEVFWSEETFRIFGYDPSAKPTLSMGLERAHPDDLSRLKEAIERSVQEERRFDEEYRLLMPDGGVKNVHVVASAEKGKAGDLLFVGAIMDVTERVRTEESLRKAQAHLAHVSRLTTIGELSASIAHEVNQPLTAVVSNANACSRWLDREVPNLEEVRNSIRLIVRDAHRGSEVVTRIRGLLKREQPAGGPVKVNELIQDTIAVMRMELQGIALETELARELPEVMADRVQLQQVLLNLMANAIDAMKPVSGRVRRLNIRTEGRDGRLLVVIQDSGVGLGSIQPEQVFETFYTTKPDGLGMGLSICRSIIEGYGGRLWAEPNDDYGSAFQFTLPVQNRDAA